MNLGRYIERSLLTIEMTNQYFLTHQSAPIHTSQYTHQSVLLASLRDVDVDVVSSVDVDVLGLLCFV